MIETYIKKSHYIIMKNLITVLFLFHFSLCFATENKKLGLLGKSELNWYIFNIYKIELYSNSKVEKNLLDSPLRLKIIYNKDFLAKDLVAKSMDEMKQQGLHYTKYQAYKRYLRKLIPDVEDGESLTAVYDPDRGIQILLNEQPNSVKIRNLEFCRDFLNIWLGTRTTHPNIRKELLQFK